MVCLTLIEFYWPDAPTPAQVLAVRQYFLRQEYRFLAHVVFWLNMSMYALLLVTRNNVQHFLAPAFLGLANVQWNLQEAMGSRP